MLSKNVSISLILITGNHAFFFLYIVIHQQPRPHYNLTLIVHSFMRESFYLLFFGLWLGSRPCLSSLRSGLGGTKGTFFNDASTSLII